MGRHIKWRPIFAVKGALGGENGTYLLRHIAPELGGGFAGILFKEDKKVFCVAVPCLAGDLLHGEVRLAEELADLIDAHVLDGVVDGHAGI